MSVLYDPHSKRPQPWTYISLFLLPPLVFLGIYFYGDKKAQEKKVGPPVNSASEPLEE